MLTVNMSTTVCLTVAMGILTLLTCEGCFIQPYVERIDVGGTPRAVCEYNDVRYLAGTGYIFKTADCYECKCDEKFGLLCCGYGKNQNWIDFVGSEECDVVVDQCDLSVVRKDDHSRDCHTGEPIYHESSPNTALMSLLQYVENKGNV